MWEETGARKNQGLGMYGSSQATKKKHVVFNGSDEDDSPVKDGNYANPRDVNKGLQKTAPFTLADTRGEFGLSLSEKCKLDSSDKKRKHVVFEKQSDSASDSDDETSLSEGDFEESDEASEPDSAEDERTADDYSAMSMEELLKLQEEMGTKAFREKVLNVQKPDVQKFDKQQSFKRLNKNRPSEMPLMRKRARQMNFVEPGKITKKKIYRDPRFDDLSGTLQMNLWDERYHFLKSTRKKEMEVLKNELKEETRPHIKEKLKQTLQRMENQQRESVRRDQQLKVDRLAKKQQKEALRRGQKPKYVSDKKKKMLLKTMHFEQLKKDNKVGKYLERKEKKLVQREKKQVFQQ